MAKDKDKTTPASKGSPSGSGHKTSGGGATRSAKNRELRRCRKAIKHLTKRNRIARAEGVRMHMEFVQKGEQQPPDNSRRQRRIQAQQREMLKAADTANERFRKENPGLAADFDSLNNHPAVKAERAHTS